MGSERSGNRLGHSLSAVQVAQDRISATDAEVPDAFAGQHSFYPEDFPKGILLPGLPLHLGEGWRSITPTRRLGDIFLGICQRRRCNPRRGAVLWAWIGFRIAET